MPSLLKVLVVHDTQVPDVSDRLQHELGSEWAVTGVKYFDEAVDFLNNNDDIFALISDGEIPKSQSDPTPYFKYGHYLLRWLANKGNKNRVPYFVIAWTSYDVSKGPTDEQPIFHLRCTSSKISTILREYLRLFNLNIYGQSLQQVLDNEVLKKYLVRGKEDWLDIDAEIIIKNGLCFIHDARHKAISCYLSVYNDIQNLEYWKDQDQSNNKYEQKIKETIQRIKRVSTSIMSSPKLGGLNFDVFVSLFSDIDNGIMISSTANTIGTFSDSGHINSLFLAATGIETKLRELCNSMSALDSEDITELLILGGTFSKNVLTLRDSLEQIVNFSEDLYRRQIR